MTLKAILASLALFLAAPAAAQPAQPQVIKLWPNGTPGCKPHCGELERAQDYWVKNIQDPTVTAFPADPKHNNGSAIVILPGGGHNEIVWTTEGINAAKALNRAGINAFVVKYRLARERAAPTRLSAMQPPTSAAQCNGSGPTRQTSTSIRTASV